MSVNLYQSAGPSIRQAAEVIVTGPKEEWRGSGYLLSPALVLTAAHVVEAATTIRVRFEAQTASEWSADVVGVWRDDELDVAILFIRPERDAVIRPARFGRLGDGAGPLTYSAVGFPRFKIRGDDVTYRDSAEATGEIAPLSNHKEHSLELAVQPPEADWSGESSPWEGMSGAAVFCSGRIIGVVTRHYPTDGLGRLTANRVDQWFVSASITGLREILGPDSIPAIAEELPDVTQPQWSRDLDRSLHAWAEAEMLATDVQPYRFVDEGVPSLTESYVERSGITDGGDRTSVTELLGRVRHVLVEAPAGVGKSALTYRLARETAAVLLESMAGPGLPAETEYIAVRVPARDLSSGLPLPDAIARSVRRRLGEFLTADLGRGQFDAVTPGGRPWLVMVDGLDEILDKAQWRKAVTAIAADIERPDSPYRWLVTTRPVTGNELDPLRNAAGVATLALEALDDRQLRELATAWLQDPGARDTERNVTEFMDQASRSLQELVRVPLLAAVALLLYRISAERHLPTTRPGLYQQMMMYFLNGRGDENDRQSWFERLVGDAGGPPELARWLYSRRSELLYELSVQTLGEGAPTIARATSWIKSSADYVPEFLHNWNSIVSRVLFSTGVLTAGPEGSLAWLHQTVPEYLVARQRAGSIAASWPPADLRRDLLLVEAMGDDGPGEQAKFTIACRLVDDQAAAHQLFGYLMARSGDYDYLLKYNDAGLIVGNDSDNTDQHILLAAALLSNGISPAAPLPGRVVQRLLYRARSVINSEVYCRLVALQPGRLMAKQALDDMVANTELSMAARAGALVAIARVYGIAAAAGSIAPLLEFTGVDSYVKTRGGAAVVARLPDRRLTVANELAQLGEPARELVANLLDLARIPADDKMGCLIAAEAAALVDDLERAKRFIVLYRPRDDENIPLDFAPLLIRVGLRAAAVDLLADAELVRRASEAPAVARSLLDLGEAGLAADVARLAIERPSQSAYNYETLALAGHADEVMRSLPRVQAGDRLNVDDWVEIAQALYRSGNGAMLAKPLRELLVHGRRRAKLASFLLEIGDERGQAMMRAIAADAKADLSERSTSARRLLDTPDQQEGIDVLLEIGRDAQTTSRSVSRDLIEVARALVLAEETEAAAGLLRKLVTAGRDANGPALELLCRVSPADGIDEIDRRLRQEKLEDSDVISLMMAKATALKSMARAVSA